MAVDAVSGGSVNSATTVTGAVEFDIGVNITAAPTAYAGYQARVEYNSAVIKFVPVTLTEAGAVVDAPNSECSDGIDNDGDTSIDGDDPECALAGMNVKYPVVGGLTGLAAPAVDDPGAGNLRITSMGGGRISGTTSFVGQIVLVRYKCVGNGTTSLHLVSISDDPGYYSTTLGAGGTELTTTLADATVTCQNVPMPTPTATPTPMPTPTPVVDCTFIDDFGRGNQFLVSGAVGRFIGTNPEIDVTGVRVLRFRGRVVALSFRDGVLVAGSGTCPEGPGRFQALKIARLFWLSARWLLEDVTSES
jgi:hypothetical protein